MHMQMWNLVTFGTIDSLRSYSYYWLIDWIISKIKTNMSKWQPFLLEFEENFLFLQSMAECERCVYLTKIEIYLDMGIGLNRKKDVYPFLHLTHRENANIIAYPIPPQVYERIDLQCYLIVSFRYKHISIGRADFVIEIPFISAFCGFICRMIGVVSELSCRSWSLAWDGEILQSERINLRKAA